MKEKLPARVCVFVCACFVVPWQYYGLRAALVKGEGKLCETSGSLDSDTPQHSPPIYRPGKSGHIVMAYPQKYKAIKNGIPQGRSILFLYNRNRNSLDVK